MTALTNTETIPTLSLATTFSLTTTEPYLQSHSITVQRELFEMPDN